MDIKTKFTWTKIGVGLSIIISVYSFSQHLIIDYNTHQQAIKDSAIHAALRQVEWNNYRLDIEKRLEVAEHTCPFLCVDSMKKALDELEIKNHIKPKF
jgi:hypothetical protein